MQDLAKYGRNGDTELIHMSKGELDALGMLGNLTRNPDTGLPEAFKLKWLLPAAAIALTAGAAAPAIAAGGIGSSGGILGMGLGPFGSTVPVGGSAGLLGGVQAVGNTLGTNLGKMLGPAKNAMTGYGMANTLFPQPEPIQQSPVMDRGQNPTDLIDMARQNENIGQNIAQNSEMEMAKRAQQIAHMRGMYGTF